MRQTKTSTSKNYFAGKNERYFNFFKKNLPDESAKKTGKMLKNQKEILVSINSVGEKEGMIECKESLVKTMFEIDEEDFYGMGKRNIFEVKSIENKAKIENEKIEIKVLKKEEIELEMPNVKTKLNKRISKMHKHRNLTSQKSKSETVAPAMPCITEPYFEFCQQDFNFSAEELKKEPVPETMWVHMSCLYWIPEIYFDNSVTPIDARNLKGIEKDRFHEECSVCKTKEGASVKCAAENCEVRFHVECARRAKIHLEMVVEYQTKFNIHCTEHTPKLLSNLIVAENKKSQEEVVKYYKYLQRLFKAGNVAVQSGRTCEKISETKIRQKMVQSITVDDSGEDTDNGNEHTKMKLELSQVAKFLPDKSRLVLCRARREILQKPVYQFVINLQKVDNLRNEFEFVGKKFPEKMLYKNFVHKKDRAWKSASQNNEAMSLSYCIQFKAIVGKMKEMKRNQRDYFKQNDKGEWELLNQSDKSTKNLEHTNVSQIDQSINLGTGKLKSKRG